MYLGPAAWRPFNAKLLDGFNFEKGGGMVGGFEKDGRARSAAACSNGARTASICANGPSADCPPPVEYNPPEDGQIVCQI